jgi:hypothetical protein
MGAGWRSAGCALFGHFFMPFSKQRSTLIIWGVLQQAKRQNEKSTKLNGFYCPRGRQQN